MGHQVIQQPDGLLAIYSSESDVWIRYDMTADEVVEYYAERAARDARASARRTCDLVLIGAQREVYYQFAMTFAEANARSKHGDGPVLAGPVDEELLAELENPDL